MAESASPSLVAADYELVDFGRGRKLERFGPRLLDRPAPAAEGISPRRPDVWSQANGRFDRTKGQAGAWTFRAALASEPWPFECGSLRMELKPSEAGQVGLFPEQSENWQWIAERVRAAGRPIKVLNLFAYTGASTLAASAAGAAVTHVDAASSAVAWARRNAERSGLSAAPIRWITEDARKFVGREMRRGAHYDAVILDPPAYGHGPQGDVWRLSEHLAELWQSCMQLTGGAPWFLLASCHSEPWAQGGQLAEYLAALSPELRASGRWQGGDLVVLSSAGARLHCGAQARWQTNRIVNA